MTIHLQGMGLIGCAAAWALDSRGEEFTWEDANSWTSWKASTGAVYPSLGGRDEAGYNGWVRWRTEEPWRSILSQLVEQADYWYCTKNPPHGMKEQPVEMVGPLKRHPRQSFHLNAQEFVKGTRNTFLNKRRAPAADSRIVVSHGFNDRMKRVVWGWSQLVELDTLALTREAHSCCLYLRKGRVVMAYAYPKPGTPWWYAGSTLLVQSTPKERDTAPDVARWHKRFAELTDGLVQVTKTCEDAVQGWRPSTGPVAGEDAEPLWREVNGVLQVMPLWHSGVRWLPLVVDELVAALEV